MIRRLPIIATLVVLAAAGTMVALGIWQLQRAEWKADLIARYQAALSDKAPVAFPRAGSADSEVILYRRSQVDCSRGASGWASIAGRNRGGEVGYVHIATCGDAAVQLGWSRNPNPPGDWEGGEAAGVIVPYGEDAVRLVADPPLAGLEASAAPDPADMPNNHLAYAVQWFFFALTALVIYALAVRKRLRAELAERRGED